MSLRSRKDRRRGAVLIIVIWVCLGLVALALYFANSMTSELRAADNRAAQLEAQQAVAAGTRYAAYQLKQYAVGGLVPRVEEIQAEALPVGDATFWFIGRDNDQLPGREPYFGLVDEASKINLNTANRTLLEGLPGITPEQVEYILSWRRQSGDSEAEGGDGGGTYSSMSPPRTNKGAPFESADELRLVYGMTLDVFLGEDTNRNGILDANEDDAEASAPRDDQDGQLLAGLSEYVTVVTRHPSRSADGQQRVDIRNGQGEGRANALRRLFQQRLDPGRGDQIIQRIGNQNFDSVAEFMLASGMTVDEFDRIHTGVKHTNNAERGLINVNTASEVVLACIPGIGPDNAATLVAYRLQNPDLLNSFAWLMNVLDQESIRQAGRYITDQSYQFSADVAAVGRGGRGYARARTIFDMSNGTPRIIYHQDMTSYGWALGSSARETSRVARNSGL